VELHKLADYRFKLVQSGDQMTPNLRVYALCGSKLSEQLQSKRLAILLLHDPTRLTDGIEASDDPILAVRRGVYKVSVAHRTGDWKGPLAALE
jgi:hypothetical protein